MGTTMGQTGQGGRRARIGDDLGAYDVCILPLRQQGDARALGGDLERKSAMGAVGFPSY